MQRKTAGPRKGRPSSRLVRGELRRCWGRNLLTHLDQFCDEGLSAEPPDVAVFRYPAHVEVSVDPDDLLEVNPGLQEVDPRFEPPEDFRPVPGWGVLAEDFVHARCLIKQLFGGSHLRSSLSAE